MSGKKRPTKKDAPAPRGSSAWQVLLERIDVQNRAVMEAVEARHEEMRREIQNFRDEVHASLSLVKMSAELRGADIRDLKTSTARIEGKVDRIDARLEERVATSR